MASENGAVARYLLDVNVLVALAAPQHVHHGRAHDWFSSIDAWATSPVTESAFLRLLTNVAVVGVQVPMAQALEMLQQLHADPTHAFIPDDASFASPRVGLERLTSSRDVTDVHLVDLAARSGNLLATLDRSIAGLLADEDRRHVFLVP